MISGHFVISPVGPCPWLLLRSEDGPTAPPPPLLPACRASRSPAEVQALGPHESHVAPQPEAPQHRISENGQIHAKAHVCKRRDDQAEGVAQVLVA